MTVQIEDHPNSARGVYVTVSGAPGQRATLKLDGKASLIRLRSPGAYSVTDPPAVTTVGTNVGGPAEVELAVGGAPVLVVIELDEEATITETDTNNDGTVDEVVVTPGAGDVITVNGAPIGSGGLNLATLLDTKLVIARTNAFGLRTVLDPGGVINPLTEPVRIRVGTFATTIPPGRFVLKRGTYGFIGTIGGVTLAVAIVPKSGGRYAVDVLAGKVTLARVNPVTVGVSIGDDSGITSVNASFVQALP
jgi:hypothetical protein